MARLTLALLLIAPMLVFASSLSSHPPAKCKNVEAIVSKTVSSVLKKNPDNGPPLIALAFVDCLINGCDRSALLKNAGGAAERDGVFFLGGFETIDMIKMAIDKECGPVVSCADIIVLAARDAVKTLGGPYCKVQFGRMDGNVSMISAAGAWTASFGSKADKGVPASAPSLLDLFKFLGLGPRQLVSLSGAHTIGNAHCASVGNRISPKPTLPVDPKLKAYLTKTCAANPAKPGNPGAEFNMDLGPQGMLPPSGGLKFDNSYFVNLVNGKGGVLNSDEALIAAPETKPYVIKYAKSQAAFFADFCEDIMMMSAISPSSLKQMPGGPTVPVYPHNFYGIVKGSCQAHFT